MTLKEKDVIKEIRLTLKQIEDIIKYDRKKLLNHIGNEMAYGMDEYLDYPINIPIFDS